MYATHNWSCASTMLTGDTLESRIGLRSKFIAALAVQTILLAVLIIVIEQWSVRRAIRQQTVAQGEAIARTIGFTSGYYVLFGLTDDLRKITTDVHANPAVEYALAEIIRRPDQINLARMNQGIGYSQKHFISMFKRQVGVAPKAYLRIMRFQKAISEIEERKEVNWAIISQDCGFYDQAHFINDFKFFSGFTPEEYIRRKNDILNYVPVA